jgi:hypothetical protein
MLFLSQKYQSAILCPENRGLAGRGDGAGLARGSQGACTGLASGSQASPAGDLRPAEGQKAGVGAACFSNYVPRIDVRTIEFLNHVRLDNG